MSLHMVRFPLFFLDELYMCVCMCVYMYTCINIYTYVYIYTYICVCGTIFSTFTH